MRALDHCIGGNGKLISFWNMSDRTIIPNTEINKVLIAFCIAKYRPIRSNSPVLILSAHQKTKGRHLSTLHLNNYLRPNAGATLSNTPLMYFMAFICTKHFRHFNCLVNRHFIRYIWLKLKFINR